MGEYHQLWDHNKRPSDQHGSKSIRNRTRIRITPLSAADFCGRARLMLIGRSGIFHRP